MTGGAGVAIAAAALRDDVGGVAGLGTFAGVGYEFVQHWNLELKIIYNRFPVGGDLGLWSLTLTINVRGY